MRLLSIALLASIASCTVFAQTYTISTFAGGVLPINITGTSATLSNGPQGAALDSAGRVLFLSQNAVLRWDPSTGLLTLVAGTGTGGYSGDNGAATNAQLNNPSGLALDSAGNIYIADSDNNRVRKVAGGIITTVAGDGLPGYGGDNGPATSARLDYPLGVAVDSAGNLYIADSAYAVIRKVTNGIITTVAGGGSTLGDGGPATSAQLMLPSDVALDSAGDLYIADFLGNRVRKVTNGTIATVAGNGSPGFNGDGAATSAELNSPNWVALDGAGNLYVADAGNERVRKVTGGVIVTVAGDGNYGFSGDGGAALAAALFEPSAAALDNAGNLYIADTYNNRLRRVTNGIIDTVAGGGSNIGDGGPALSGQLNEPYGVALDAAGDLYIADNFNNRVRKVSNGVIGTVAGNGTYGYGGDNGPATSALLASPVGLAVDSAGNLYIADADNNRIREVSNGIITTVVGNGAYGFSGDNGAAASASLYEPGMIAFDSAGNLYIADNGNNRIRKVSNGIITTVAGNGGQGFSGDNGPATSAELNGPYGIAVDPAGDIYFSDNGNERIRKITNGAIATVAGSGAEGLSGDNGPATAATLFNPTGVALDSAGQLYIADTYNDRIRRVSNGTITTVAGGGNQFGDNGPATGAELDYPLGIAFYSAGNLYVSENANSRIRLLQRASLSISKTHTGNFFPGESAAVYTVRVSNGPDATPTSGAVTVTEQVPAGMTLASMAGAGWTCTQGLPPGPCTRSDSLAPGASYPPITVTVNVASNAASPLVNTVLLSAGGSLVASASDTTIIAPASHLGMYLTHTSAFSPGEQNAIYLLTVSNAAGAAATTGAVTVTEDLPAGLTLAAMSGAGWACVANICTRSDSLAANASYPAITVAVNVASNAGDFVLNSVTVSGGGSPSYTATDPTGIGAVYAAAMTAYTVPTANAQPAVITPGPDGALWVTEYNSNQIGRITTAGAITAFPAAGNPWGIAAGPDGALWFTELAGNQIGRVTTSGTLSQFPIPTANAQAGSIVAGPERALWFAEQYGNKIGRITTGGSISEFLIPTAGANSYAITAGPDGALWFTENNKIGRVTTSGVFTEYSIPTFDPIANGITAGPDGALWFTEAGSNKIGRITTAGSIAEYYVPNVKADLTSIVVGSDGALWFTEGESVGRVTTSGVFTEYSITGGSTFAIASGSDGALWFTLQYSNTIGRIVPGSAAIPLLGIAKSHSGNFAPGQQNAVYTVTVSNASNAPPTAGALTVTESLPSGLTLVSMAGAGWTCAANVCTRSDSLPSGAAYAPLTVTVNVAANAASPQVNTVSVSGGGSATVSASDPTVISSTVSGLAFYPVTPCRVVDTRYANAPTVSANTVRTFPISNTVCGIPSTAQAYSLNVTVVPAAPLGYLTVWPTGFPQPVVSTLNSSYAEVVANAAIVPSGAGSIDVYASDTTEVVIDINGYFAAPGSAGALVFYPVTPCRSVDTRSGPAPAAGSTHIYTIASTCGVPSTAQVFSLNMTALPSNLLNYLTVWPAGQSQPLVSTLNSSAGGGQIVANAAIVPAGTGPSGPGAISVYVTDAANLLIDVNGYFAPPGGAGALYFYPVTPCRIADTRNAAGTFGGPSLGSQATRTFPIPTSSCGLPSNAQAYALNMTVVPPGPLFYLTTWPAGQSQPVVSTLNDLQGGTVANAAIVPAGAAGSISVYVSDPTQLIIDVNGYFGQ